MCTVLCTLPQLLPQTCKSFRHYFTFIWDIVCRDAVTQSHFKYALWSPRTSVWDTATYPAFHSEGLIPIDPFPVSKHCDVFFCGRSLCLAHTTGFFARFSPDFPLPRIGAEILSSTSIGPDVRRRLSGNVRRSQIESCTSRSVRTKSGPPRLISNMFDI